MRTLRFSDRRVMNTVAALGILVGAALPAFVPAFASAQEITTRSIDLSNSATSATGVNYDLTFTPVATAAGGFLIDFCSNTPLVGNTCTAPSGLSTAGIGTTTRAFSQTTDARTGPPRGHRRCAARSHRPGRVPARRAARLCARTRDGRLAGGRGRGGRAAQGGTRGVAAVGDAGAPDGRGAAGRSPFE